MVSATLIEKLEKLSPELQKKIETSIGELLEIKNNHHISDTKLPYTLVIGNHDLFGDENILADKSPKFKIKPGFGGAKGLFGKMSDDFDAPLDEFKDYM